MLRGESIHLLALPHDTLTLEVRHIGGPLEQFLELPLHAMETETDLNGTRIVEQVVIFQEVMASLRFS